MPRAPPPCAPLPPPSPHGRPAAGSGRRGTLQLRAFVLTFLAYGSLFLLRQPLSVVKYDLSVSLAISVPRLAWLDTALLLPMAVLQIFCTRLVDQVRLLTD